MSHDWIVKSNKQERSALIVRAITLPPSIPLLKSFRSFDKDLKFSYKIIGKTLGKYVELNFFF